MTTPENTEPTADPGVTETTSVTETDTATPVVTEEPTVSDDTASATEDASDAALRAWAKDNGIEGVPASGKLSAAWREQITNAMGAALESMAAALDPKEEASVGTTSSESSTSVEETKTEEEPPGGGEEATPSTEEPVFEYRSVWKAPNTYVSSQAFTA